MPRQRNERPVSVEITPSAGRWHGFLAVGVKADGEPDRIHRSVTFCPACKVEPAKDCAARCYRRCEEKVREAENALAAGVTATTGKDPWADQYFTEWLANRRDEIEYGTWKSYDSVVRLYLVPNVKGKRLRQLNTIAALKALRDTVVQQVSPQAGRKMLRVLRKALNDAVRDRLKGMTRSEAKFVPMPDLGTVVEEVLPLTLAEAQAILPVIMARDDRARWLLGLVHGPRQGEALGLRTHRPEENGALRKLSDLDLDGGTFSIREKIGRRTWEHGCDDPHACAATRPDPDPDRAGHLLPNLHKLKPCPPGCKRHERDCPPPCTPQCTKHASACPHRKNGGLVKGKPKSKKGVRTQAFEPAVLQAFEDYAKWQESREQRAGSKWEDTGYFFTNDFGRPIDPSQDWATFQQILSEAGLPGARVHALRHSTATFYLAAGVDKRIVMDLLGWSQDMTHVYQHPTEQMKRDATTAVGALLFPVQSAPDRSPDGSATALLPDEGGKVLQFRPRTA